MGQIIIALGFITAVLPPILQAAGTLALPPMGQKILAIAGSIVFLAGVAHDALLKWQAASHVQAQMMLKMKAGLNQ